MADETAAPADPDKDIVTEAKERYQRASDYFGPNRVLAIADTQFAMGDSDNGWQWPSEIRNNRILERKVCLTVNATAQHCNQIINNMRQNRPQCRVLPVDNYSDKKTAEILGGLIRNIQVASNADDAHDTAAEHCIYGGEGYWRIVTEYESETSFNQVIRIKPLVNPLLVYIDPNAKEMDKSDAEWGFIFEDIGKEQAKRDYKDIDASSWINDPLGWVAEDTIRIAEYFYCERKPDTSLLLIDGSYALKSELEDGQYEALKTQGAIAKERATQIKRWKWCKLVGGHDKPVDTKEWAGSYLPIVSVIGKELNVNGELVRKGVVRDLKDPARMLNFSYSEAVQTVALQNKVPYIGSVESTEGYEEIWRAANVSNVGMLPYNQFDDQGRPLERPMRQEPAVMPAAQVQMLQLSTEQMRAASGQQNANFGIKSEAQSGVGIQRLKAQGEIATFHFPDNQVRGLRYEAKLLIDLIPKVMDVKQVVRVMGLDGKESQAMLDPELETAYQEAEPDGSINEGDIQKIFNPTVGIYDAVIDTGPSYQTQRQEAQVVLNEIATKDQNFMQVAGDIYWRAQDVPLSDELAKRYEKIVPPELQDKKGKPNIPPEVQAQLAEGQQQVQQLSQALEAAAGEVEKLESKQAVDMAKIAAENEKNEVARFQAETDRLKLVIQYLPAAAVAEIASSVGVQVATSPDIYPATASPADARQQEVAEQQMAEQQESQEAQQTPETTA